MNVVIGLPSGGLVTAKTAVCLGLLMRRSMELLGIAPAESCYISLNRNQIVRTALASGADAVLWIDGDQTFPAGGLERLLAHDLPMVGASYRRRAPPHSYMLPLLAAFDRDAALAKVSYLPGGFCLVRRQVYETVTFPWYRADYGLDPEKPDDFVGEDVYFCREVRNAGFDIHCDMRLTLEVGHVLGIEMRLGTPPWPPGTIPAEPAP